MSTQITEDQVRIVYRAVLNREPENDDVVRKFAGRPLTLERFIAEAISSPEFSNRFKTSAKYSNLAPGYAAHNAHNFLAPQELRVNAALPPRVLLIGSCMLDWWGTVVEEMKLGVVTDRLHIDMHPNVSPPYPWHEYRFQIGQVPLRSILLDTDYIRWIRNGYGDPSSSDAIFKVARHSLESLTRRCCCWSEHTPVFILNFLSPMQSVNGRLFGKFDMRDNRFFIHELNRELEKIVHEIPNAYILDADECAAAMGRRFFQDDSVWIYSHGGLIDDGDYQRDVGRLVETPPLSAHYKLETRDFIAALFLEADAAYRSLRGVGAVKMVCVDLDDTLWRGVLSEVDHIDPAHATEGWPRGILEALAALKRRGILLCILSKNNEDNVRRVWSELYERRLPFEDFAIRKINWKSKAENLSEAIAEVNILPNSVVFLDDNPLERNMVASAFPDVRVITSSHLYWKRILMWSAETQGAVITDESVRRTEMVKAQIEREATRTEVSREDFLRDLDLRIVFTTIDSRTNPRFPRVVELINKTNQFNTTGRRWTAEEIEDTCHRGIVLAADVRDRFSGYGLVAVAILLNGVLEQVVMSCRVLGMDVELAVLSRITGMALESGSVVTARTIETKSNLLSRDLFQRGGWDVVGGVWQTQIAGAMPAHVRIRDLTTAA